MRIDGAAVPEVDAGSGTGGGVSVGLALDAGVGAVGGGVVEGGGGGFW